MRRAIALLCLAGCAGSAADGAPGPLERELRRALLQHAPEARPGIWLSRLDGRELLAIDADRPVRAASTLKVLVLVEAWAQVGAGAFRWEDDTTLTVDDVVGGAGSLRDERPGSTWSWAQLARRMIAESDNTASNMLLRRVGMDRVNARAAALGLHATRMERAFLDVEAMRAGRENRTTPRDMGRLLLGIARREILTPEACEGMAALLEHTARGRIASGVPREVPVGHKGGVLPGLRADVGWVLVDGQPYVLSIFLEGVLERPEGRPDGGRDAIEAAARAVWRALGPGRE